MSEMQIINTYDQHVAAGGDRIYISLRTKGGYRDVLPSAWVVHHIKDGKDLKTDPDAGWYAYGNKWFSYSGRDNKKNALALAIAWANKKYGYRMFVRNRMGDWVEKEVNDKFPLPKKEAK